MATIKRYLSTKVDNQNRSEVCFRITISRSERYRVKTGVLIDNTRLNNDGRIIYPRYDHNKILELRNVENKLVSIERTIYDYIASKGNGVVERAQIEKIINNSHLSESGMDGSEKNVGEDDFFKLFERFLDSKVISPKRSLLYKNLVRELAKFEMYRQKSTHNKSYRISIDNFSASDIRDFEKFCADEWKLFDKYNLSLCKFPDYSKVVRLPISPSKRGQNTIIKNMQGLRAFFNWCVDCEYLTYSPFRKYHVKSESYGTPYYLTIEERDYIADFDLSEYPKLEIQRDIFVFQCLIGCRFSDLRCLTKSNIVNGNIEYIAEKTKKDRINVIRVPLSKRAKFIVEKYDNNTREQLLPFTSNLIYNRNIKEICRICGIDRIVTIINPKSGEDERKPIYELASSHMARRTFVGNLYKKVKDPSLVGALSGHKEGSQAFARYREIDDDIRKELIDLIE